MSVVVPGQLPGVEQMLFRLRSFNANAATGAGGAQKMERLIPAGARYSITRFDGANGSISLTTATVRFDSAAAAGTALLAATAMSAITGPTTGTTFGTPTVAARGYNDTGADVYAALGTAQGAPATADLFVIGRLIGF